MAPPNDIPTIRVELDGMVGVVRPDVLQPMPTPTHKVPSHVDPTSQFSDDLGSTIDGIFELPFALQGAPSEIRIFPSGPFDTKKGKFLFDGQSVASVMASYAEHGTELHFDYEHQALISPAVEAPAAGWFSLEMRGGELWAVNIRWTPRAEQMIASKEYRYYSPAFDAEPETGRVLRLINIALTNLPATKRLQPLVAASEERTMAKKLKKIGAGAKSVAKTKLTAILTMLDGDSDADSLKAALSSATLSIGLDGDDGDEAMKKASARLDALSFPKACRALKKFLDDDDSDAMKALDYADSSDLDIGAPAYKRQGLDAVPDGTTPSPSTSTAPNTLREQQAQVQQLTEKVTSLESFKNDVCKLTGKPSTSEALGVIAAGTQALGNVQELSSRMTTMEREDRERKFDDVVRQACAGETPKITPGFARSKFITELRGKSDGIVQLRSYLESATPIPAGSIELKQPEVQATLVSLTAEEKHICKMTMTNEGEFLAQKKKRLGVA